MLKAVFGFTLYRVINLLFPIITLPIILNFVDKSIVGMFFVLQSYAFWVSLIIDFGFIRTGVVDYINAKEKTRSSVITEIIFSQLILLLIIILITFPVLLFFDVNYKYYVFVIFTGFIQGFVPKWLYQAENRMLKLSFYESISKIIGLVVLYILMNINPNLESIIYSYITMYLLTISLVIFDKRDTNINIKEVNFEMLLNKIKESKDVFFMRVIGNGYLNCNVILLSVLSTPDVIAIYGLCERVVKAISSIVTSFGEAIFPLGIAKSKISSVSKNLVISVLYSMPVVIFSLIFSKEIILILSGESVELGFKSVIFISPIFFAMSTVLSLNKIVANGLYKLDLMIQIVILFLSSIALILLYLLFDTSYPYFSFLASSIISFLCYYVAVSCKSQRELVKL
ncbi:oligosaccharide flippase family protein [Vibrio fluvialis]|nr:oligosaccharide flippase family protein [Vibrio fluvialis]